MLTGKQKREFRAAGNQLKATVMVGREGITPRLTRFIDEAFNNKILVKVKILDTCEDDRQSVADQLGKLAGTEVVQILGKTILLFRPLPEED